MRSIAAAGFACLILASGGCGGGTSAQDEASTSTSSAPVSPGEFGSYPADPALDEKEVVEAYVDALDARDGQAFCRVVASWISGHFDIAGTDPDFSARPIRCPQLVAGFIDFPWENQERDFKGAEVADFGDLDERGDLVGVPVSITLHLEEEGRGVYDELLSDVVWVTREDGAWRVAKLSVVAAWASLVATERGDDLTTPPNLSAEGRAFAAESAKARKLRSAREASYRAVGDTATCPQGKAYPDGSRDVVDYRHPAPASPTPQLGAADIRTLHVYASEGRICVLFELAGDVQEGSVFDFAIVSPDFEFVRSGFSQGFEVELRADGRARVTSGVDDERRPVAVPAEVGRARNRLQLAVDAQSFASGRPFPGSVAVPSSRPPFELRADVTVRVSEKRLLHDDLGRGSGSPEGVRTYAYP